LITGTACAQHAKQYSFKHFSVSNGLASNTVSRVVQDNDGYIWMATVNGLQRYDGNSFITFKANANDKSSIPSTHIVDLFLDKKKNLWLISDQYRVGIFDTKKFAFKEVSVHLQKPFVYQPTLLELPSGELLLKEDSWLYRYAENKNQFVPADHLFPLPSHWKPDAIHWDESVKKYWILCDSGFVQFDPASRHANYRGHNVDKDPVIKAFEKQVGPGVLQIDAQGNVIYVYWPPLAGGPDIYRYNRKLTKVEKFSLGTQLGYHEINGFLKQRNGRLWVYGVPFFMEWTEEKQPFIRLTGENSEDPMIEFDYAYQAFEDKESNIWMATDNGVYLFNPDAQIFNTYNIIRPDGKPAKDVSVQAIAEMDDGKIYVGCWGTGVYCFDKKFNPLPLPSAFGAKGYNLSVWDMSVHPKTGELWITLQAGGIAVYNSKTNRLVEVYPEIFGGSTIRQVDEDTSGNMWFGTQNGKVIKWDYKKAGNDPTKGYELVCQTGLVFKVHYDYQGFIWVGTHSKGLLKIDARTKRVVKVFTTDGPPGERLFSNLVGDMTYYNDSTLIVSAGCLNILNTRTNQIHFLSADDGLPSNTTESIERDKRNILWVGMTNGICRVNLEKKLVSYFDRRDGIAYDKFEKAGVKELEDGKLVFFTSHNFLSFDPEDFGQQSLPPKPYITSFKLAGQTLSMDSLFNAGKVVLSYDNTSIGIDFSAMTYLQQRKLHYYYMLEGVDKDWIHVDHPIEAIYNYLPAGSYTFKVKSENADGVISDEIASIPIEVRPPFWKAWWFYSLIILLAIVVLYIIDKERVSKRKSLAQMRRQIANNLHSEVSNTLNNINVLSEMAKIKADKNLDQSKEFIGQISHKSRYMIEAMEDMLWSIDPQNDSMKKTVLRIKELTEGMRSAYDADIDLIVDHKVQALELDMKLRYELFFYYKEAMTFLLDHSMCKQIFVNIKQVRSKMLMEILSECHVSDEFKVRITKELKKRVAALPASWDVAVDNRSLSVVLYLNLK
jgi:ligand-binding sensor domain-containing protein